MYYMANYRKQIVPPNVNYTLHIVQKRLGTVVPEPKELLKGESLSPHELLLESCIGRSCVKHHSMKRKRFKRC